MNHLYAAAAHLEISYQDDAMVLMGRWLRPLTDAEARQDYAALLAAAKQHQCHCWLFDIWRRGRSHSAMLNWLLAHYYAQAVRELGAPVRLVYFLAPGLRQEFQGDGVVPFRMNSASPSREALAWLQDEQRKEA